MKKLESVGEEDSTIPLVTTISIIMLQFASICFFLTEGCLKSAQLESWIEPKENWVGHCALNRPASETARDSRTCAQSSIEESLNFSYRYI